MTRMWWEFQKFEGYTESQVNEARISFIGYGAVTYAAGEVTPIGDAGQLISTRNSKGEYYRNGEAMMVPGEMWGKPLIQVEIGGIRISTLRARTIRMMWLRIQENCFPIHGKDIICLLAKRD